jgi:hypothetical protein
LEYAYGPIVDSYAQKYNIPTDIFRSAIKERSGFDPQQTSATGRGIANLDFKGAEDIGTSLDFVGKYLDGVYKQTGDWDSALGDFLGTDEASKAQQEEAQKVADSQDDSWTGKAVEFLKKSAFTILIVMIGLVLILGSSWKIINSSK